MQILSCDNQIIVNWQISISFKVFSFSAPSTALLNAGLSGMISNEWMIFHII